MDEQPKVKACLPFSRHRAEIRPAHRPLADPAGRAEERKHMAWWPGSGRTRHGSRPCQCPGGYFLAQPDAPGVA